MLDWLAWHPFARKRPQPALSPAAPAIIKHRLTLPPTHWPHDDTFALMSFYGRPWEDHSLLVKFTPPWRMSIGGHSVPHFLIHGKCLEATTSAFAEIWDACDHKQSKIDENHLHLFGGSYAYRPIRGSSRLSTHAFGAAIDVDPEGNPLGSKRIRMPQFAVEAFKRVGATWGGIFQSRKDGMHFQFAHEGR